MVLAGCGPHAAASHRAHPTEAPARSTARAHFERTEIGSICAHMGPEDGDNSNTRANVAPFRSRANSHREPIAFSKFKSFLFTRHDLSHKTCDHPRTRNASASHGSSSWQRRTISPRACSARVPVVVVARGTSRNGCFGSRGGTNHTQGTHKSNHHLFAPHQRGKIMTTNGEHRCPFRLLHYIATLV